MEFRSLIVIHQMILKLLGLIGGMFAGFTQSFIVCPADVVKCVMQLQYEWLPKKYTGSIDCFKKIYLKGGLSANFKGMMATFARDVP